MFTDWTRRQTGLLAGAAAVTLFAPNLARNQSRAKVLVVGGGAGGASVAGYLAGSALFDITVIEPKRAYTTCFLSSHYLAGLRTFEQLTHAYDVLARQPGVTMIHDTATTIDPATRTVRLDGGVTLSYDRLVLAPGSTIRDGVIDGYDKAAMQVMPHAWKAGEQTLTLRRQLESMADGGLFVMVAPPDPFPCPPAPYERVSLIAAYFKLHKPRSKIIVLDAKDTFVGQNLFQDAWNRYYPDMIEWLPAQFTGGIKAVEAGTLTLHIENDSFKAAVANVIPAHSAGDLARQTGLADTSSWCPVDPLTFESLIQPDIHLIGDAIIGGDMPKTAFAANSQAKACAAAIAAAMAGKTLSTPHLVNTCYAHLAADDAWRNASEFEPVAGRIKTIRSKISRLEDTAETRRSLAREADDWYETFTKDVFG
ncbi:FAD-dependent oxidoreductase [Bradyrhizobium prioriisuperbiae]|uniref:FAD-dependent oxidoreductase n=1 Tax=Bradyrhizobium prioriisuperbiae TaxID=2854389 RepID=UPI0028E7236F|nr:FAD-dependent oxidoreductase [Bradyrhizobium prioritasuperba]